MSTVAIFLFSTLPNDYNTTQEKLTVVTGLALARHVIVHTPVAVYGTDPLSTRHGNPSRYVSGPFSTGIETITASIPAEHTYQYVVKPVPTRPKIELILVAKFNFGIPEIRNIIK